MVSVSHISAFFAGILSFFAPCVIPLIPIYIGTITGASLVEIEKNNKVLVRKHALLYSLIFILGFSAVFVVLGMGASFIGSLFIRHREALQMLSGTLLIVFGLLTLGFLNKVSFFQKEFHIRVSRNILKIKFVSVFMMGVSFALAWTPCVGPILGAILTLAVNEATIHTGAILLFTYALGIAIPFMVISLTLGVSLPLMRKIQPHLRYLHILGGIMLVGMGILLVTNQFVTISSYFLRLFSDTPLYKLYLDYL